MTEFKDEQLVARARERARASWKILPVFAVTALVFWVLWTRLSTGAGFLDALRQARWAWLTVPVALMGVNLCLSAVRWRIILDSMGVHLGFGRALHVILGMWPFALITPSRAGDLLRAVAIRDLVPASSGSSSVVAEKLVDIQSLCLLGLIGSAMTGLWWWFGVIGCALVGEWVVAWLLLLRRDWVVQLPVLRRAPEKVAKFFDAFEALRRSPRHFLMLSVASLCAWIVALALVGSLLYVFGAELPWTHVVALWPVSVFIGMLPLTVSGMGTRDAAFVYLNQWVMGDALVEAPVLAATFMYAMVTTVAPAILGLPLMLKYMRQWAREREEDRDE